jgi:hypothetical protein
MSTYDLPHNYGLQVKKRSINAAANLESLALPIERLLLAYHSIVPWLPCLLLAVTPFVSRPSLHCDHSLLLVISLLL